MKNALPRSGTSQLAVQSSCSMPPHEKSSSFPSVKVSPFSAPSAANNPPLSPLPPVESCVPSAFSLQTQPRSGSSDLQFNLSASALERRVNAYNIARYHEALQGKDSRKVGKWAAFKFKSQLQECPCGRPLPCPTHGDFPPLFWTMFPDEPDYILCLEKKGLPYTSPYLLLQAQRKREEETT